MSQEQETKPMDVALLNPLNTLADKFRPILQECRDTVIITDAECHLLEDHQAHLAGYKKECIALIKPYKDTLRAELQRFQDLENDIKNPVDEAIKHCATKCGNYQADLRRETERAQARLDAAMAKKKADEDAENEAFVREQEGDAAAEEFATQVEREVVETIKAPSLEASTRKGTSQRKKFSCEVIDPDKVPLRFRPINGKLLDAEARNHKENFSVDGCKLIVEVTQSVRAVRRD